MNDLETGAESPLQKLASEIRVVRNFQTRKEATKTLKTLFDIRPLWNERKERTEYRNTSFYCLGVPMYLDCLDSSKFPAYVEKSKYFNQILLREFPELLGALLNEFDAGMLPHFSMPGFHIFTSHLTGAYFFGRQHKDIQWQNIETTKKAERHFSFTYVLQLPYSGGGLWLYEGFDERLKKDRYDYEENTLYIHSGQFYHAIAETPGPMLPHDYRITLQGHGFELDGVRYLYW